MLYRPSCPYIYIPANGDIQIFPDDNNLFPTFSLAMDRISHPFAHFVPQDFDFLTSLIFLFFRFLFVAR